MHATDSQIQVSISKLVKGWKILTISAIIGGVVGLIFSMLVAPQYQATAVLDIGIDYNRTFPLSKPVEEHALERVRALLLSDLVLDETLMRLNSNGIVAAPQTIVELRPYLRLVQGPGQWSLQALDEDAELALAIVAAWADTSLESLETALYHSYRAAEIQNTYSGLGCSLTSSPGTGFAVWHCAASASDPNVLAAELRQEAALSHGLLPAMSFSKFSDPALSNSTQPQGRGFSILMGIFSGLALGFWAVVSKPDMHPGHANH